MDAWTAKCRHQLKFAKRNIKEKGIALEGIMRTKLYTALSESTQCILSMQAMCAFLDKRKVLYYCVLNMYTTFCLECFICKEPFSVFFSNWWFFDDVVGAQWKCTQDYILVCTCYEYVNKFFSWWYSMYDYESPEPTQRKSRVENCLRAINSQLYNTQHMCDAE